MRKTFIIIIFLISPIVFSQKIKFGARMEPSLSWGSTSTLLTERKSLAIRSSDIRASISLSFPSDFILSLRPGIVFGSNYGGVAAGLFGLIPVYKKWYSLFGLDVIKPLGDGSNTLEAKDITIPYFAFGIGHRLNNQLSFELQFHYSLNQVANSYRRTGGFLYSEYESYKIFWLLKLSVGFNG